MPRQPSPNYVWIEGYWYPQGSKYRWHDGFWARPPYQGAYWVDAYHYNGRYYSGRWEGRHRNGSNNGGQQGDHRDARPDDHGNGGR